jgi:hypothetical protein
MPHLPYAQNEGDEFLHPSGEWFLINRAITFDNWLLWRHALPLKRHERRQLTAPVAATIEALAGAIHAVHQTMPGYKGLDDTPFRVSRWWDPSDREGWQSGACCLFLIKGFCSADILEHGARSSSLSLQAVSELFVEANLLSPASQPLDHPDHCSEAASNPGSRKSPSRRPGKSGSLPRG